MSLMFEPLRKYAQFSGRARRSEYWLFALFTFVVSIAITILRIATGGLDSLENGGFDALSLVNLAFSLAMLVPSLAVSFRRLHDTDRSAWWILIGLIPLIGAIVLLIFYLLPGTTGPNKFGPDPKQTVKDAAETFA
ncbi:DUF805 domain-containing protein [Caulobacter flavus]|jgi:uncharacterized membrane protein YhaH (DUF805 family)|uniref:DUF805 domain-containing protein n=1 Tax=Caulobacter flavus TaxID=1679497 RepID=A0A2N5CLC6_9CAUL|nr:DUF805 domain-containing protein [Caulobacter flavus]AYV48351.1 DUF805 domain-containing protein [Caulobacter flavus]PLR06511.1 DUF805 domain-containing protein [Caulobacter flavus]